MTAPLPKKAAPKRAIFFDRDGVLNVDSGYPHRLCDCVLIEGAAEAVRLVNEAGYRAFIVTNQGGIALGYYGVEAMHAFNARLASMIAERTGGVIDDIAFCPHHPEAKEAALRDCPCRKPSPHMLIALAEKHGIDLSQSLMVGDRQSDIEAGRTAGCRTLLFEAGRNDHARLDHVLKPLLSKA